MPRTEVRWSAKASQHMFAEKHSVFIDTKVIIDTRKAHIIRNDLIWAETIDY